LLFSAFAIWSFTTISADQDRGVPAFYIAEPRAGGLSEDALDSYRWIAGHLPPHALILANGYTEGALGMLSHRTGLLDGRTPFAQPDPWRAEAIRWLSQARSFFLRPTEMLVPGNAGYVLVAKREDNLGGSYFPTDYRAVREDPSLERVKSFGGVTIYAVRAVSGRNQSFGQSGQIPTVHSYSLARTKWLGFLNGGGGADLGAAQPSC
jgi:hypothetical protein